MVPAKVAAEMKQLLEHAAQSVTGRILWAKGDRILVAVSGGLDSMVLLKLLQTLALKFDWRLSVAHFNHQLRGRASDADERFVRQAAHAAALPCRVGRGDVKALAQRNGLSVEMAARQLRHEFLARAARASKCRVIALAHHADDQVELFFLRLLRGAGGDGLAGMKWRSVSPADKRVQLCRPLLDVTKDDLERFAREHGVSFREDASNASRELLRNRVRHELLPLLRDRFQPGLVRTIPRLMDVVGADAEVAVAAARAWLKLPLASRRFAKLSVGLQRRVLQCQLQRQGIMADFDLIESLRMSPGRPTTTRPGLQLACDAAGRVVRVLPTEEKFRRGRRVVALRSRSGRLDFGGVELDWQRLAVAGGRLPAPVGGREFFDASRVGSSIILRHWRPGDRFQPIGMETPVKLQDWFVNQKIPRDRRRQLVLATTRHGEIFWVEGLRIGARFRLTSGTERRLRWGWRRAE